MTHAKKYGIKVNEKEDEEILIKSTLNRLERIHSQSTSCTKV